jgi:hypothetical protein
VEARWEYSAEISTGCDTRQRLWMPFIGSAMELVEILDLYVEPLRVVTHGFLRCELVYMTVRHLMPTMRFHRDLQPG